MKIRTISHLVVLVPMLVLALVPGLPAHAQARGSVRGQVVDGEGKGIRTLKLRFTAEVGGDSTVILTKKNGKFFKRLTGGRYTIDLVDSDLFILSLEYEAKDEAGLVLGEGQLSGDPRKGVTGVPLSDVNAIELTLTVAEKGSEAARQLSLAFAMPELSAAAELYNAGKYEESAAEARQLVNDAPDLGEGYYLYGMSLDQLGRLGEADMALSQAVELIPDYQGIWGSLGEVRLKLAAELEAAGASDAADEFSNAADALTRALERDPDSLPLQLNLAACLDRLEDTERLMPLLAGILEQDPAHLQSRLRLASLHSQRGDQEQAMALLQEIPGGEKRAAVTLFNIAVRADEEGDRDGALLLAQRAAEIDPLLPHPRQLIAQLLLAKGEMAAAKEAIRAFIELAPDGPDAETYRRILQQLEEQQLEEQ